MRASAKNSAVFFLNSALSAGALSLSAPELGRLYETIQLSESVARAIGRAYPSLTSISFDYAIMEKTRAIEVVHGDFGWDDVGSYAAFPFHFPMDASGNVIVGDVRTLESRNSTFVGKGVRITAWGLDGLIVASCGKDVLVMPRSKSSDVKNILKQP